MTMQEDLIRICEDNNFNGVVLIAKQNTMLFHHAFGYQTIESEIPMTTSNVFRIGSITKQFTAVAILQLVERGLLSLEDTIDQYLDGVTYLYPVTIHHLLSNSSGIPNFNPLGDYKALLSKDDYHLALIEQLVLPMSLNFTPGERFEYSSSGYLILTYIIEQMSNMSYQEYLKQNVFDVLDMSNTGFCFSEHPTFNFVSLYDSKDRIPIIADPIDMRIAHGGGGLYSSTDDLHKWNQGLIQHKILSKESIDKMMSVQTPINAHGGYGYGVISVETNTDEETYHTVYHPGNGPGVYALNSIYNHDVELIMISNINDKQRFYATMEPLEDYIIKNIR